MKPKGPVFDGEWIRHTEVVRCSVAEVSNMIARHYLHKRPAVCPLALMMRHRWTPKGMIIFAFPPKETSTKMGGVVWELARLWISDDVPQNGESWLIGSAIRYIQRWHPEVEWLVSYADPSVGHHGKIYMATNWIYDGMTDAERKTPRKDAIINGVRAGRVGHAKPGDIVQTVARKPKHRYLFDLRRHAPRRNPAQGGGGKS